MENAAERILRETSDLDGAQHLVDVEGLSSARICVLLNRLVAALGPGENYLEIGTFRGRTLVSAAYGNRGRVCIACDKFRVWGGRVTGLGYNAKRALRRNIERYREGSAEIRFHHMPSHRMFRRGLVPSPVGVYFYDGDHSYEGTRENIVAGAELFSSQATLLVDDWNDPTIQRAARDAIRDSGLRVTWEREITTSGDRSDTWWNGIGIFQVER